MWLCLALILLCVSKSLCEVTKDEGDKAAVDYCAIKSCGDKQHVMCHYKKDKLGKSCANFQQGKAFNESEKKGILKAHNKFRSAVAIGAMEQRTPNGQQMPGAEDIYEVFWDDELEMFAQRWARQCKVFAKDKCRNTAEFSNVGQLMFKKKWDPSSPLSFHVNMAYLRAGAASTVLPLLRKRAEKIPFREQRVVAQLVWGSVNKLGCARAVFDHDPNSGPKKKPTKRPTKRPTTPRGRRATEPTELVVCNYNDGGNMTGPVYNEGKFCTYCFCSSDYDGLCAGAEAKMVSIISLIPAIRLIWCM